mmetsp:Transcript_10360/g.32781  ORF Transcript_10360/g.32781 Transcript_10360/m.32781 type:complete len:147 (-) Transcript_10360:93-533(-)
MSALSAVRLACLHEGQLSPRVATPHSSTVASVAPLAVPPSRTCRLSRLTLRTVRQSPAACCLHGAQPVQSMHVLQVVHSLHAFVSLVHVVPLLQSTLQPASHSHLHHIASLFSSCFSSLFFCSFFFFFFFGTLKYFCVSCVVNLTP